MGGAKRPAGAHGEAGAAVESATKGDGVKKPRAASKADKKPAAAAGPSAATAPESRTPGAAGQKWLLKSEPDEYSWNHLKAERDSSGFWDGVRNHQAKNILKSMQVGDQAFFYHSSCKVPGIVGIAEVCSEAVHDHTALDPAHKNFDVKSDPWKPTWVGLHVKTVRELRRFVTLTELKTHKDGALSGLTLLRNLRLSCQPVSQQDWDFILGLAEQDSA